jgi:hypothetical protein
MSFFKLLDDRVLERTADCEIGCKQEQFKLILIPRAYDEGRTRRSQAVCEAACDSLA